jgi:sec-independent protein translocase protein TatA
MFGIGMPELMIILVLALVVLGPQKLPELARSLGKGLAEFKRASNDFRRSLEEEARTVEVKEGMVGVNAVEATLEPERASKSIADEVPA